MSDRTGVIEIGQLVVSTATLLVLVGLGVKMIVGGGAAPEDARTPIENLKYSAYTNVDAAHITITNMGRVTAWACVRGVVSTPRNAAVESVPVCTGDIKPHSTVELVAPYTIGAVVKLCPDEDTKGRTVDWSKCSFDVEDAK